MTTQGTDTATPGATLSLRAINRATLARQLLLARASLSPYDAIAHLAGLQAQTPHSWYVGLWSRLADFRAEEVSALLVSRRLVRIALQRATIHLVTATDCLAWRELFAPTLDRGMRGAFGKRLAGIDRDALTTAGRALVAEKPQTFAALGAALAAQFPGRDPAALAQAIRAWVPLAQVPPRGLWGQSGPVAHRDAERWLGATIAPAPDPAALVRRYLAAFGPATVRDMQAWSGVTKLRAVVERLRPELLTFRDGEGQELFDLPGAPRPHPDTPAPARFLYDFDNLFLSHADRRRVVTADYRHQTYPDNVQPQLVLLDGFTAADWAIGRARGLATLTIRPFRPLTGAERDDLVAEGSRLLTFTDPAAAHDIAIG
jgi:hypothetical protein